MSELNQKPSVHVLVCDSKQERNAVASKLRNAAAVLFDLKFADNIH